MKDKRVNISDWIIYIGMICIFVVFTIICSALGKQFLTLNNVMNIINQASINAVVAIGASLVILTGGIDLSVGSRRRICWNISCTETSGRNANSCCDYPLPGAWSGSRTF